MRRSLMLAAIVFVALASGCVRNKEEVVPSQVCTNVPTATNSPCDRENNYEYVKAGDVYAFREARIVLDVTYGMVIYRQIFYHEPGGWTYSTNCIPVCELTNRWIRIR